MRWARGTQKKSNTPGVLPSNEKTAQTVTPFVYLVVWVAMSTGFLVGFSDGDATLFIVGFRLLFFPQLHVGDGNPQDRANGLITAPPFCAFHHREVQVYLALPCLTCSLGALASGWLSHRHGRKATIWVGCLCYVLSKVLLVTAFQLQQAWVAQCVAGFSVGLLLQAPMLEVLEVAPFHRRGTFGACTGLGRGAGFLCGALLSFGLALNDSWGWRVVPLFGIWPAVLVMVLLWWLPETPSSLVQRGKLEEGRLALHRVRGFFAKTEQEFKDILQAAELGSKARTQFQALHVRERALALVLGLAAASFVSAGGGPVLTTLVYPITYAIGYGRTKGQAMSLAVMGFGALAGGVVAVLAADSIGRRSSTVAASSVAAMCHIIVCLIIKVVYLPGSNVQLAGPWAWSMAALLALSNAAFVAGPGTMLHIYSFEIQPLPTRALATALIIAWLSLQDFAWVMSSVPIMCASRGWGLFLMFAVLNVMIAVLAAALLLKTAGVPLEVIHTLWKDHWFWRRFCQRTAPAAGLSVVPELSAGLSHDGGLARIVSLQRQNSQSRHGGVLGLSSSSEATGCVSSSGGDATQTRAAMGSSGETLKAHHPGSDLRKQLLDVELFRRLSAPVGGEGRSNHGKGVKGAAGRSIPGDFPITGAAGAAGNFNCGSASNGGAAWAGDGGSAAAAAEDGSGVCVQPSTQLSSSRAAAGAAAVLPGTVVKREVEIIALRE